MPNGIVLQHHDPPPRLYTLDFHMTTMTGMSELTRIMIRAQQTRCNQLLREHGILIKKRKKHHSTMHLLVEATRNQLVSLESNPRCPPGIIVSYELHKGDRDDCEQ